MQTYTGGKVSLIIIAIDFSATNQLSKFFAHKLIH